MQGIANDIHQALENGELELPSLPELAVRIRDAVNSDDASAMKVAKLIEFEPNIAARIIQMANSSVFSGYREATSCEEAIMRLGLRVVRDIVTCMVMKKLFTSPVGKMKKKIAGIWEHSVHVAAISYVLAGITPRMNPEKALLGGLMHNIGALPVIGYGQHDEQFIEDNELLDAVIDELGGPVGKKILQTWNFDAEIADIPQQSHDWSRDEGDKTDYADIVIVARLHSLYGKQDKSVPPLIEVPAFRKMRLSEMGPDASLEVLHQARSDIKQVMKMLA